MSSSIAAAARLCKVRCDIVARGYREMGSEGILTVQVRLIATPFGRAARELRYHSTLTNPSPGCAIVLLALGALVALAGLASIADGSIGALVIGLMMAAAGVAWLKSLKPTLR